MRIIIEQYPYKESDLREVLPNFERFQPVYDTSRVRLNCVGYCFLPEINDCAFFLPKVVLGPQKDSSNKKNNETKEQSDANFNGSSEEVEDKNELEQVTVKDYVLGEYDPKMLLNPDLEKLKEKDDYTFINNLSVWIYRALKEYIRLNPKNAIVKRADYSLLDNSPNLQDYTFIDTLLSLIKFNEENQDYFMFIVKNIHSGYNKINWRKTISTKQPMMQDGSPIYMNPVNRKKQINFDEELLIIFFSILDYVNKHYGFPVTINFNYELITGTLFDQYLNFYGVVRLKQIKYKYFSDKALKLWGLCYRFFEHSEQITSTNKFEDFLLAYKFENVFEAIIDELIGQVTPRGLKDQKDGKVVDHLYRYSDLVHRPRARENEIYYIADSKYYKIGASIGENPIYKQYTYAKNVIQYDFDLFFDKMKREEEYAKNYIGYVDALTEGYNITPNFFISAEIGERPYVFEEKLPTRHTTIVNGKTIPVQHLNRHFNNRLFDRDTLWISHYDINFLTILALYGRGNDYDKSSFRDKTRRLFRDATIEMLNSHYDFAILTPLESYSLQDAINAYFQILHGKAYCPDKEKKFLILALEKAVISAQDSAALRAYKCDIQRKNDLLKEKIASHFNIFDGYKLDDDINEFVEKATAKHVIEGLGNVEDDVILQAAEPPVEYEIVQQPKDGVLMVMMLGYNNKSAKFIKNGKLAVGIKLTQDSFEIIDNLKTIGFILFHHRSDEMQHLFRIKGDCVLKADEEIEVDRYKNVKTTDTYIVVDFEPQELDASRLHSTNKKQSDNESRYEAQYATLEELY